MFFVFGFGRRTGEVSNDLVGEMVFCEEILLLVQYGAWKTKVTYEDVLVLDVLGHSGRFERCLASEAMVGGIEGGGSV